MPDKRNWFQKFLDQTSFGAEYTLHLTPEQGKEALDILSNCPKKDQRARDIIEKLQGALKYPTTVGQQKVITITLDTSNAIRLKDILNFTRDSVQCVTTDSGFIRTTRRYGSTK